MKKIVSIAAILMLVAVGSAMAGLNASWDDCGINGLASKVVTCTNSATAVQTLYISFLSPNGVPVAGSTDVKVDVQAPNTIAAGSWWLNAARFGASTGPSTCPSWWGLAQIVQIGPNVVQTSPSRLRLRNVNSVPTGSEQPLDNVQEYFSTTFQLKFGVGTFGNAECTGGGAFAAEYLDILQPGGAPTTQVTGPQDDNCAMFRTGGGSGTCPAATPTKKATWGSIKALYR